MDTEDRLVDYELTPAEESQAAALSLQARTANSEHEVAEVLALAIAAYVAYVKRAAIGSAIGKIRDVAQVSLTADILQMAYAPYWNTYVAPLFRSYIFFRQAREAKALMPDEMVMALADDYAKRLHGYFTTTSAEAMVKGFNSYVNRRVPTQLAAQKVFESFGLTSRQMSSMVSLDLAKVEPTTTTRALDPRRRIKGFIAKALDDRIKGIAEHEAFVMSEEAKQVGWLYQQHRGFITGTATKMWMTARDERVCGVCGPMHKQEVPLGEHFVLPSGVKVWTTGVHPKCRCRMMLRQKTAEVFGKAEEFKRDRRGRFAEVNTLSAKQRLEDEERARIQRALDTPPADEPVRPGLVARPALSAPPALNAPPPLKAPSELKAPPQLKAPEQERPAELKAPEAKTRYNELKATAPRLAQLSAVRAEANELYADRVERLLRSREDDTRDITRAVTQNVRPTILLPGYLYGEPESGLDFMSGDAEGYIQITEYDHFTPVADAGPSLYQQREQEIAAWTEDIVDDPERTTYSEVIDGQLVTARLDWDDVENVLHLASMDFPTLDPFGEGEPEIPLLFKNAEGQVVAERFVPAETLAEHLAVDPDNFITRVYRVKEVHMDATMESGSLHGYESWTIAGNYRAESKGVDRDEFGTAVEIIELTPIVDEDD